MVKLQVLICTTAARLAHIDTQGMPALNEVEYIISCQGDSSIPEALQRRDVSVHFFADKGLSINRNHAFDIATAPYLLIADDDLRFIPNGLNDIIAAFDADDTLDIITTRAIMPEQRVYPPHRHNLAIPTPHYSAISFEIAVRRRALESHNLRFSPLAGIGAPYLGCGEEEFFLHKALKSGLNGCFLNIAAVEHPGATTSVRSAARPEVIRAKGALMRTLRGSLAAAIRLPLEAHRAPVPFFRALHLLTQGYIYAGKNRSQLK